MPVPAIPIEAAEVAEYFRQVVNEDMQVVATGPKPHHGDLDFLFGSWQITFIYFDSWLDYCESVSTPDGRYANSDDWEVDALDSGNPFYLLEEDVARRLEEIMEQAIARFKSTGQAI